MARLLKFCAVDNKNLEESVVSKKKRNKKGNKKSAGQKHVTAEAGRPINRIILGVGIVIVVAILCYFGYNYVSGSKFGSTTNSLTDNSTASSTKGAKTMQWASPPPMSIDQGKEYYATISTNFGDIVVQLLPKDAPIAVNNFVFLARQGFYDGLKFHRVVKGFVIQGGDPKGDGSGGRDISFQMKKLPATMLPGHWQWLTPAPIQMAASSS